MLPLSFSSASEVFKEHVLVFLSFNWKGLPYNSPSQLITHYNKITRYHLAKLSITSGHGVRLANWLRPLWGFMRLWSQGVVLPDIWKSHARRYAPLRFTHLLLPLIPTLNGSCSLAIDNKLCSCLHRCYSMAEI